MATKTPGRKSPTQRVQVVLPADLARSLRKEVPRRERSTFIAESLEQRLMIQKRKKLLQRRSPAWSDEDHPYLNTSADTLAYLDAIRTGKDPARVLEERYNTLGFTSLDQVGVFREALRKGMSEHDALRLALPGTASSRRRTSA